MHQRSKGLQTHFQNIHVLIDDIVELLAIHEHFFEHIFDLAWADFVSNNPRLGIDKVRTIDENAILLIEEPIKPSASI